MAIRAFVIMPFEADFNDIYEGFIKPTLEEAGYEVFRANDLEHQHSILKDIVTGLVTADLIVADLSDSNPNVYYELGIAHGLRRPVILLTQDIDALPFDLRPYRVIPYDTHFARIGIGRTKLKDTAVGAREGRVLFSNPVSDFSPAPPVAGPVKHPSKPAPEGSDDEGEEGLWDHLLKLKETFEALTSLVSKNNESTLEIAVETQAAGELLKASTQSGAPGTIRDQREVLSQLGDVLQKYAEGLEERNITYGDTLATLQESLEYILSYNQTEAPGAPNTREAFRDALRSNLNLQALEDGRRATENLAELIRTAPSVERRFNRARQAVVRALRRYGDNLKLTMAVMSRALELGDGEKAAS